MPGRRVPTPEDEPRLYDRARVAAGLGEMPVVVADEIAAAIDAVPATPGASAEEPSYAAKDYEVSPDAPPDAPPEE